MTEGREAARRPARAPLRRRSRRRWAAAGAGAVGWILLEMMTRSVISATVALVAIVALGVVGVAGLRAMGVTRDHPWIQRMASRPWRDGQDVLQVAMRHMSDVFVITPSGSLLAPNVVELQLNPNDLASLCEQMELGVICASMTEVYRDRVAQSGARFSGPGETELYVVADEFVPPGRFRLRQGYPVSVGAALGAPGVRHGDADAQYGDADAQYGDADAQYGEAGVRYGDAPGLTASLATIMERSLAPVPVLRLVTGSSVTETIMSGARAGRGPVELELPNVPTVSREHAKFTFSDGRWWITNQGRNGLTVNGAPVAGEQPLSDGDEIRWGSRPDALLSRVEIS
jgi:hypothetical protein